MRSYPEKKHSYSAVAILTLAQVFAFIDRQIPSMLVEPIKQDFNLTDSQIALLGGAAFSIFYAIMALPIGYAVDRYTRTKVLGTGIFLWSLMTALAGLANSFGKLFGARIGVAVGEAVMAPISVSLVSDSFPENKQGKPMGIITAGVYIGIGITLLGGGFLIDYLTSIGGITLPLIGYLKPWQATFMIVGIPGLVLAIAAFYLKEPQRVEEQLDSNHLVDKKNVFLHLKEHRKTLIPMFGGLIFMALIFYSFSFWAPTMMIRTFDISLTEVGFILGMITIISSITGTIIAGSAVDYLRNRNYSDAPVRAAMIAVILALPPIISLSFVQTELGAWICIAMYLLFISSFAPLGLLAISGVSTGNVKGQTAAIHAFLMMVFGLSLGPQLTAFFTDFVFVDPNLLINSVSLTGLIVLPISALLFKLSLSRYKESSEILSI